MPSIQLTVYLRQRFAASSGHNQATKIKIKMSYTSASISNVYFASNKTHVDRSQWPRGLRRKFSAARLLRSWVRIPPTAWMFVCCECCVLSGRGLCDEMIPHLEESYRL